MSTSFSPFYLNYGQHPQKSTEPQREVETEAAEVFATWMKKIREAVAALKKTASDMKRYYDEGRQDAPEYQVGDKVYLEGSNISTNRPLKKLDDRQYSPGTVVAKVGQHAYKLQLPSTWRQIHPVFNMTYSAQPGLQHLHCNEGWLHHHQ